MSSYGQGLKKINDSIQTVQSAVDTAQSTADTAQSTADNKSKLSGIIYTNNYDDSTQAFTHVPTNFVLVRVDSGTYSTRIAYRLVT